MVTNRDERIGIVSFNSCASWPEFIVITDDDFPIWAKNIYAWVEYVAVTNCDFSTALLFDNDARVKGIVTADFNILADKDRTIKDSVMFADSLSKRL